MTGDEIREAFLNFFEGRGHLVVPSSSLIPAGDPTLLLTSAGMVQFKPYFMGESEPPNRRLASAQKCFRTTDIEEVGDASHLTFFEMLGNFSVGDYFKEGAIAYALEFVTQVLMLPQESFYITIYEDDDEAEGYWIAAGIPKERISRFGKGDNWWGPAGDEGPCGPCSELHYDFGSEFGCGHPDCGPNCPRCGRFVELWNLVFMQYYQDLQGNLTPLPAPNIDTGIGLERTAIVMQNVPSIYETDLFAPLVAKVSELCGKSYGVDEETTQAIRVVAEHSRSAAFLIADGVVPGNDGRGYVLRRLIRRAIRHGRKIGLEGPFLSQIAQVVINTMSHQRKELREHEEFVLKVLDLETERFERTVAERLPLLEEILVPLNASIGEMHKSSNGKDASVRKRVENLKGKLNESLQRAVFGKFDGIDPKNIKAIEKAASTLSGGELFVLYDTYGFPPELTQEIAREHGLEADMEDFARVMELHRKQGRAAGKFGGDKAKIRVYEELGVGGMKFLGYETTRASSLVVGLIVKGEAVSQASKGQSVEVVLRETPFYAEGGGQIGDAGEIIGSSGRVRVHDTQNPISGVIVHLGKVEEGAISVGDTLEAIVDDTLRGDTARNHTATHLAHAALRQALGSHVRQAGSLVTPDRLRFDYTHVSPLTREELHQVQHLVNGKIRENVPVHKRETTYRTAIDEGALAFFGDKYGDKVRVVEVSNGARFSLEVCGGTHIDHTGEIGVFYILSDSSIGSGLRRIEAVTGRAAEALVSERLNILDNLSRDLQVTISELESRTQSIVDERDEARKRAEALERTILKLQVKQFKKKSLSGVNAYAEAISVSSVETLREVGDWLKNDLKSGVAILGTALNGRPILLVMCTSDLVDKGFNAGNVVREAAKAMGGGGGGRPELGQAGGKNPDKLKDAIRAAEELVNSWGRSL